MYIQYIYLKKKPLLFCNSENPYIFFFQKEKISEAALSSNLTTSNDSSPFTFVFIFRHFILYLFSNIVIASV